MSKPTIPVPAAFVDGTLRYIEATSLFTKKASDEIAVHRGQQTRAAGMRPALLKHMIDVGLVDPRSKQAADAMLASHAETLALLKSAVDKLVEARETLAQKSAADLGKGVPEEGSSSTYNSLTDPRVGFRTSEKKASDMVLARILEPPQR